MHTSDKVSDPENEDNQTPKGTNYFSLPFFSFSKGQIHQNSILKTLKQLARFARP